MGADAEVFVFDYDTYTREVTPAFRELLLTGRIPDWLNPAITRRELDLLNGKPTDLLRYCTYFNPDFAWLGTYDEKDMFHLDWQQRACKSSECPERYHCPFHKN